MKSLKFLACSLLVGTAAFAGCRGSVDRAYFEDLDGSVDPADASSSSTSSSGDAGARDSSTDAPLSTNPATIRGTVVGLAGAGLVLQNNGGDDLAVTTGGAFAFTAQVAAGKPYEITVRSQPTAPTQTCTVTKGTGTANGVDIADILVTCATAAYPVSGVVVGLEAGKTVVLTNNGGNDLTVTESGAFTFVNNVPSGNPFNVVVKTQPVGAPADCNVSGGTGTLVTSGVDTVVVNCSPGTFTVGGTVTGLAGTLVITDAIGAVQRTISANGAFAFAAPKANGTQYNVSVTTAPAWPPANQTCSVTNNTGTVSGANISSIAIACTTTAFSVGGNLTGLEVGKSIVLTNNAGNDLTLTADGAFSFTNKIASGSNYDVVVKTQPVGTTCSISGGSGAVTTTAVGGIVVNCLSSTFTVGGNILGLSGTVVLTNNGVDRILNANGNFSFPPAANGSAYNVTVKTAPIYPPVDQTCLVAFGTGAISGANVTNIKVTCTTKRYAVGGTVTGLTGTGLILRNNSGDGKAIDLVGPFTFDTPVASGAGYGASVFTQPTGQFCSTTGAVGIVKSVPVTNIAVTCIGNVILAQNFDSATRPGLPAGWTQEVLLPAQGSTGWRTVNDELKSFPNAAYIPNYGNTRDFALVSPSFSVTTTTAKVSFWNHYDLKNNGDGGVLEIKIGAGVWQDLLVAGGSFASGGYNVTLNAASTNPIAGRQAWSDSGVVTTVANLPVAAMGESVQLRWRLGTDNDSDDNGWWIDDIVVTN